MTRLKLVLALLLALASAPPAHAALATGTVFEMESGATANNVNGAGFNPANANFLSNLTATGATGNSPVVCSASYNYASGDIGSWLYLSSGTNWNVGWYKISSVAANCATVNAAIGAAVTSVNANGIVATNAVAGIATVASPTAGTGGVDYTQQASAVLTGTDGAQAAASTAFTVTSETFTPAMAGNLMHITACTGTGCLTGWYEIVSYTSATSVVLDRTATNGTNAITAATFFVGGAGNFGALEDTFQSVLPSKAIVWMKTGTYALSAAVSTANANCTTAATCYWTGYNALRGDTPTGANRPTISLGANTISWGGTQWMENLIFTGSTSATMLTAAAVVNTKISNLTATASKAAYGGPIAINSELISLNGMGLLSTAAVTATGNYFHDSAQCLDENSTNTISAFGNLFEACATSGINTQASSLGMVVEGNTFYGREGKIGSGISLPSSAVNNKVASNIFYGLATGVTSGATVGTNIDYYNDFYNNTADTSNWNKSPTSLALNPAFTNETNLVNTGTVTASGSTLTDTGAAFGVTDNVDVLHVLTCTGCTVANYLITAHTGTTLTLNNALGTGTAVTYFITHGHNFQIGANLKGLGFPTLTAATGGATTSYPDVGGAQRQEPSGGGTVGCAAAP